MYIITCLHFNLDIQPRIIHHPNRRYVLQTQGKMIDINKYFLIIAVVHGNLGGHIHMDEHGVIFDRTLTVFLQVNIYRISMQRMKRTDIHRRQNGYLSGSQSCLLYSQNCLSFFFIGVYSEERRSLSLALSSLASYPSGAYPSSLQPSLSVCRFTQYGKPFLVHLSTRYIATTQSQCSSPPLSRT